jgi:hypothetical protein
MVLAADGGGSNDDGSGEEPDAIEGEDGILSLREALHLKN